MPTEKPRFTITMDESLFKKIEEFRFGRHYKNQTQAVLALIEKGIDDFIRNDPDYENSVRSAYTDDALCLAKDYDTLDPWGRKAVRAIADTELARCKDKS